MMDRPEAGAQLRQPPVAPRRSGSAPPTRTASSRRSSTA